LKIPLFSLVAENKHPQIYSQATKKQRQTKQHPFADSSLFLFGQSFVEHYKKERDEVN
jgi:hypothetical protein